MKVDAPLICDAKIIIQKLHLFVNAFLQKRNASRKRHIQHQKMQRICPGKYRRTRSIFPIRSHLCMGRNGLVNTVSDLLRNLRGLHIPVFFIVQGF